MANETLPLAETEFAAFGLRTTGLEPEWGHRISEIAVIAGRIKGEVEHFSTTVNTGGAAHSEAPSFADVLPDLNRLIAERVSVCYNATFDIGFLRSDYRASGEDLPELRTVDVMAMARRFLPQLGRYPLDLVAGELGISSDATSRALADAETTWSAFEHFATRLSSHGIDSVDDLETMSRPTSAISEALRRDKLRIISRAREHGHRVHLIYRALDQALTEREVTPLEVRTDTGKSQLIGFCHLRDAERTFNVDAIQDIEIIT